MRSKAPPIARAKARSTVVLPTPTSPSSSTWPRANSATVSRRSVCGWPTIARPTSASSCSARSRHSLTVAAVTLAPLLVSRAASARRLDVDHAALHGLRLQRPELADLLLQSVDIADVAAAL